MRADITFSDFFQLAVLYYSFDDSIFVALESENQNRIDRRISYF